MHIHLASEATAANFAVTGANPMLFKYDTKNCADRGADVAYLSVYEHEAEVLYPPLTHLRPVRRADGEVEVHKHVMDDGRVFAVVEVVPSFG